VKVRPLGSVLLGYPDGTFFSAKNAKAAKSAKVFLFIEQSTLAPVLDGVA
jgi:hypothetical protein